ncbi:MAG: SDR family NAD(P)-dependent oxidoreductase [Gammaproteobacteria bacterium]
MSTLRFDGRVAVITGAGRGIGRAHAMLLASRGAAVVVNDIGAALDGSGASSRPADEVVEEIVRAGGKAVANYDSVSTDGGPEAIVAQAISRFGRLDIVINNAGFEMPTPFGGITLDNIRAHFEVHFFGTAAVTLAAWPHLVASGAGRVVNTTSATVYGLPNRTGYGAAKGAIFAFTRSLALDGAAAGVKANCIAPGAGTRMADNSDTSEAVKSFMRQSMPPELVAPAAAFLAHESCPLNGETLSVGGGRVARMALCENTGFVTEDLTPEAIRDNLASVLDASTATILTRVILPDQR